MTTPLTSLFNARFDPMATSSVRRNKQYNNVGNLGDIIKHAPLPDLLDPLLDDYSPVAYLDPFAFEVEAPLNKSRGGYNRWLRELNSLRKEHPAYGRYHDIQNSRLERGVAYRCGTGMILDTIRRHGSDRLRWALLAESDQTTRSKLENSLCRMEVATNLVGNAVADQADGIYQIALQECMEVPAGQSLFALIDPFRVTDPPWKTILLTIKQVMRPDARGVAIVFDYQRLGGWPLALDPAAVFKRVARIRNGPYNLAAYATDSIASDVTGVLRTYGWVP
jgi:23S rRNA A2030 N6-methylase RlmJ